MRRTIALAALGSAALLAACEDGLIRPAAPAAPAAVALAASLSTTAGGISEAYARVDQLSVRFLAGNEVRLNEVVPFDPNASETVVSLQVPLEEVSESFTVELELRAGGQAQFRGSGQAQLSAGATAEVEVPISPVVAGVTCAGTPFQIRAYNAPRRITGAALFASGDTVPGVPIAWSTTSGILSVNQATGDVTALQDGDAQVTCSAQGFSGTRQVAVFAVVATVQVLPARDTVVVGGTAQFTAAFRDSLANLISTPRPLAWSSGNLQVATISAGGLATGVAPGTAPINATSGTVTGSATLVVTFRAPLAATAPATGVSGTGATLNGSVNPQDAPNPRGWFEWGTASDLTGAASTTPRPLDPGNAFQSVSQALSGLLQNVTYYFRVVGGSDGGVTRGSILSFNTAAAPVISTGSATPVGTGATLQGQIDPVGLTAQAWFQWGTSSVLAGADSTPKQTFSAGRGLLPTSGSLTSLQPAVTYYYRAVARNSVGTNFGQIQSFRSNGPPVTVTTGATPAGNGATLEGTVNPSGTATTAWFEWGTSPTLAGATSTTGQAIGSGTNNVAVSAGITGLTAGTVYYYRVAASNLAGTSRGAILSFTAPLPPTATTLAATSLTAGSATLRGQVNPNGGASTAWFEWASGLQPPAFTSTPGQAVGAGTNPVDVSHPLSGLQPATTYSYRVRASNAVGTTAGGVVTFTTPAFVATVGSTWDYIVGVGWSVLLRGEARPSGIATEAWFQWVLTDYESPPPSNWTGANTTNLVNVGSSTGLVSFSGTFINFNCDYIWYRAVARNAQFGTVYGDPRRTYCEGEF